MRAAIPTCMVLLGSNVSRLLHSRIMRKSHSVPQDLGRLGLPPTQLERLLPQRCFPFCPTYILLFGVFWHHNHYHSLSIVIMVDLLLVLSIVVALAILCVGAVYLLVYYQHPDDHNEAWIPKLVVIFGFVLAGATVLMLPLDVANNEGYAGT